MGQASQRGKSPFGFPNTRNWRNAVDEIAPPSWIKFVAAIVAIHFIVHVVLAPPLLTTALVFLAAAWITRSLDTAEAARQGAMLGIAGAITGLIVMDWFGLSALLWVAITVGAGWLGAQFGDRLGGILPAYGQPRQTPPPAAPEPTQQNAWVYSGGKPGESQPTWTLTNDAPVTGSKPAPNDVASGRSDDSPEARPTTPVDDQPATPVPNDPPTAIWPHRASSGTADDDTQGTTT